MNWNVTVPLFLKQINSIVNFPVVQGLLIMESYYVTIQKNKRNGGKVMFDNIGSKIKTVAQVGCIIGIIVSVISGIVCIATAGGVGILVLIGCPLLCWIGSFVSYGFGELIERVTNIDCALNGKPQQMSTANQEKLKTLQHWREQGLITEEEYQERIKQL